MRYLSEIDRGTENVTKEKHDRNIQLLFILLHFFVIFIIIIHLTAK